MTDSRRTKAVVKQLAQAILPAGAYERATRAVVFREAAKLRDACSRESDLGRVVDTVLASDRFRPEQRKFEIVRLLAALRDRRPRLLCEIGGRVGGSLALFAQVAAPDARVLSIDLAYRTAQREGLKAFAVGSQQIACVTADSHAPSTRQLVERWLAGEMLDFLLIDGDHTFEGVAQDFEMYTPLVRAGGLIALHDIVPDSLMRSGVKTDAYVGEVPLFWKELRTRGFRTEELVESWDQDGCGIGVIQC
jgi:predicted O-methyltransferase YrrM